MALAPLTLSVAAGYAGYSFRSKVNGLSAGSQVELRRVSGEGFGYSNGFVRNASLPTPNSQIELVETLGAESRTTRLTIKSSDYYADLLLAKSAYPNAGSFSPIPVDSGDGSRTWATQAGSVTAASSVDSARNALTSPVNGSVLTSPVNGEILRSPVA